jgi:hypothetical protein
VYNLRFIFAPSSSAHGVVVGVLNYLPINPFFSLSNLLSPDERGYALSASDPLLVKLL